MKKIIFLDIDGVLRPTKFTELSEKLWKENPDCKTKDEFGFYFAPYAVDALFYILAVTNASIVISSDWRRNGLSEMKRLWKQRRLPGIDKLIGITPMAGQPTRADEISAWLDENPDCTHYVVIDDMEIGEPHIYHTIKTDKAYGLTMTAAEAAALILKGEPRIIIEKIKEPFVKVIQIINKGNISYHVSWDPNNGNLTSTKDIEKASVFKSDWDLTFIPQIKEFIKEKHANAEIKTIDFEKK